MDLLRCLHHTMTGLPASLAAARAGLAECENRLGAGQQGTESEDSLGEGVETVQRAGQACSVAELRRRCRRLVLVVGGTRQ